METKPINLVAWINPNQSALLLEVIKKSQANCIAVGCNDLNASKECAQELGFEGCHDLRTMATKFDDALLWIAQHSAYDIEICELLRNRTAPTITSTPLSGSMDSLIQQSGQLTAAYFVPLMRRSKDHSQIIDEIEQFGQPELVECTMTCAPNEGTLGSRLFDAMDYVDSVFGTPESVQAFHVGKKISEEACELSGHMTVNLKFAHQACATLNLSDQAAWNRETQIISKGHTIKANESNAGIAPLISDAMHSVIKGDSAHVVADAPRIIALCEAARLSCLTESIEQPSKILEMLE